MHSLMKDLLPDISPHQMEIDRVHRALTAPRPDGLPRDILVKPHFYRIKEKIMKEPRTRGDLTMLGHTIQLFGDISQVTIQKRRSLKPLLANLINRQIKYCWSFPFRLSFTYKGESHFFTNFQSGEEFLLDLGLVSKESPLSRAPHAVDHPVSPLWSQSKQPASWRSSPIT